MAETQIRSGAQDTGNPVMDSLVNMTAGLPPVALNAQFLQGLHTLLLGFALKEPFGLKARGPNGLVLCTTGKVVEDGQ